MEHTPTAYRDLLKVVPLVIRESYQALRAHVRGWTLAQRTYDDLGRHTTPTRHRRWILGKRQARRERVRRATEWSRSMYIRRELRRFGNEVIACPQTATAEALEWLGVGPKREFGDL